MTVPVRRMQVY